jgi:DNA mismatch repair protein MutS
MHSSSGAMATGSDKSTSNAAPPADGQACAGPPAAPPASAAPPTREERGAVSPSMAQFLKVKAANPGCLLFYRMGDFYELFFEDAVAAAAALGIVLTKRGKHLGEDIPMCGVPVHRADEYLQRLIKQGFRVAVCEQLEDPAAARKRSSKAVLARDVVRLVTPGTLTEDSLLDAKSGNYLTAIAADGGNGRNRGKGGGSVALASLDISTGDFEVAELKAADFPGEIVRLAPGEVIAAEGLLADAGCRRWIAAAGAAVTPVPEAYFDARNGERLLKERLQVADLAAFGSFSRREFAAIGALFKYVELTQIGRAPCVRPPRHAGPATRLVVDAPTRTSLELLRSLSGARQGSLLAAIDRTLTAAGARELAARLSSPLRDIDAIAARLDAVSFLRDSETLRGDVRAALRAAPDSARAIARLALQRGGPRDLGAVRDALAAAAATARRLAAGAGALELSAGLPAGLARLAGRLTGCSDALRQRLSGALVDDPPHLRREGGFVRAGFSAALDEARTLRDDSRKVMAALEAKYLAQTGVKSLKVRHNNILGFFIEVPAAAARPLLGEPFSATFRHRQTMAGAVRFTTAELHDIESRILLAAERALAIEQEVFAELAAAVAAEERALGELAAALAALDCEAGLAELAAEQNYVRPVLDDSTAFDIRGGRHPVVEQALKAAKGGGFIDNDCVLASPAQDCGEMRKARLWLLTGPNMAGKSTFLRQNALIAVLAHMGSFVPARSAHIGVVDRLYSRVGAADDLARGRSTFMVEMVETAGILNGASDRSLVILDEIGRGTATFDGLSIAWAVVEYLHDVTACRALFATHYHELTALAGRLGEVANVTMDVREWRDEIVFLHKVKAGAADRSYGIQVAKLAGLPRPVTARAAEVLALLEKGDNRPRTHAPLEELPLFAARPCHHIKAVEEERHAALAAALADLDPDELSPRAALDALYRLKESQLKGRDGAG